MARSSIDLQRMSPAEIRSKLDAGLGGDAEALTDIVNALTPVVHTRVARAMMRRRGQARGRSLRQDLEDLVQDVFAALFAKNGKVLRAWEPERGLSFTGFVGFLAEREVGMMMRISKRNPWTEDPTAANELHDLQRASGSLEQHIESRQLLTVVAERLRERLSPLGRVYFQCLYVEEQSPDLVAAQHKTTLGALYSWRSRLLKHVREIEQQIAEEERVHVERRLETS